MDVVGVLILYIPRVLLSPKSALKGEQFAKAHFNDAEPTRSAKDLVCCVESDVSKVSRKPKVKHLCELLLMGKKFYCKYLGNFRCRRQRTSHWELTNLYSNSSH
jgi:hypothetical protein